MGDGKLRCCGSPLYLKKAYGVGYNMTVEKHDPAHFDSGTVVRRPYADTEPNPSVLTSAFYLRAPISLYRYVVVSAPQRLTSELKPTPSLSARPRSGGAGAGAVVGPGGAGADGRGRGNGSPGERGASYGPAHAPVPTITPCPLPLQLPFTSSGQFPALFDALDANLAGLGVRSYGVSVTTLEEVFINVSKAHAPAVPAAGAGAGAGGGAGCHAACMNCQPPAACPTCSCCPARPLQPATGAAYGAVTGAVDAGSGDAEMGLGVLQATQLPLATPKVGRARPPGNAAAFVDSGTPPTNRAPPRR